MLKLITTHKNYILLVDEKVKPKKGEKFIIMYNDESYMDIEESDIDDFSEYADEDFTDKCFKIIAHLPLNNAPVLEGVLHIPELPKQEEHYLFHSNCPLQECIEKQECLYNGWMKCPKAASQNRRWTDEDMKNAYNKGILDYEELHSEDYKYQTEGEYRDVFIQSLSTNKLPIGFEPEYETELSAYYKNGIGAKEFKTIKNDQEKDVLQGRWIYGK